MNLLKYFSNDKTTSTITNNEAASISNERSRKGRKNKEYSEYSEELQFKIGKFAAENSNKKSEYKFNVPEYTITSSHNIYDS